MASSTKDVDFKFYLGLITLNLKFSVFKGVLGITTISFKKGRKQPGVALRTQDWFGIFRSKSGGFLFFFFFFFGCVGSLLLRAGFL